MEITTAKNTKDATKILAKTVCVSSSFFNCSLMANGHPKLTFFPLFLLMFALLFPSDGKCSSTDSGYICTCEPGFSGSNCEANHDDCIDVTCQNGGTCRDGIRDYRCHCPPGFSGKHCQEQVDLCRGFPCANGGTCIESDGRDFKCACAPGFEGKDCSINTNECQPNPCLNQGKCTDRVNEYICTCPPGFSGQFCQFMRNGSVEILSPGKPYQLLTSSHDTSKSLEEWTTEDAIMTVLFAIFGVLVVFTVVMIGLIIRRKRIESDRMKSERLARYQNEANSRRNKCLDNDPFKGSMIVNTLREGPEIRSNFNLNSEKSSALSKSSNNVYESNLKLSPSSQHQFTSDKKYRHHPSEFSATLSRTKSNNKLQFHEVQANNLRAKSTCKLSGIQVDPLVVSVLPDIAMSSNHKKVWMGPGVQRVSLTPPHSGHQEHRNSHPNDHQPFWSHASSSLYRSVHNLHRERPQSAYYPKSVSRRAPELMDPRAEYVDLFKSNIINC